MYIYVGEPKSSRKHGCRVGEPGEGSLDFSDSGRREAPIVHPLREGVLKQGQSGRGGKIPRGMRGEDPGVLFQEGNTGQLKTTGAVRTT